MKVESSIIQNKFLRVQTLNYGASLFEVFHKDKKINLILNLGSKKTIDINMQVLDQLAEGMQVGFLIQNLELPKNNIF